MKLKLLGFTLVVLMQLWHARGAAVVISSGQGGSGIQTFLEFAAGGDVAQLSAGVFTNADLSTKSDGAAKSPIIIKGTLGFSDNKQTILEGNGNSVLLVSNKFYIFEDLILNGNFLG